MMTKWNELSLSAYDLKVAELLKTLKPSDCVVHIGKSNRKTKMVNEGTSAGLCGTCDCSCKGDCRETCYAIVHGDGIYKTARKNHAENTICRRDNPENYYETFFAYAEKKHKDLRVNETGDFETTDDILALYKVAVRHPSVRVIGYTKRLSLLPQVAELNKLENVCIHFSVAFYGNGEAEAKAHGVPTTAITTDPKKCDCPSQIASRNGKVWNCSKCAELGVGCFSKKTVHFLAH